MNSKTTILLGILVVTFVASLVSRFGMQALGMSREHMASGKKHMTNGREHATGIMSAVKSLQSNLDKHNSSTSSSTPSPTPASAPSSSSSGTEHFTSESVPMPLGGEVSSYEGSSSSVPKPVSLKPYESANDNQLFQYQESQFTPQCCPSSISNDVGCLCATSKEKKDWLTRGGNRIAPDSDVRV